MPISAVDVIGLAFEHTKRQLIRPFRFGQWVRLAFVGLLAGELGSSGNFNFTRGFNSPRAGGNPLSFPKIDPAILIPLIATLVISGLVFLIVMTYIGSVMRFILFDSILAKECRILAGWSRRQNAGWKLFLWQLVLLVASFLIGVVIIGVPAAFALSAGWFQNWRAHLWQLILVGIVVFGVFLIFTIALALVHVLTKDFVVPQMALEGIDAIEGWRRFWPMLQADQRGYVIYVLMKIVLAIAAGIAVGIVTLILAFIFIVPVIAVVVAAVVAGKSAGLTWNVFTITAAVVAGLILFLIFFFFVSLISVPVIVFFPAYAIYFFAARYRPLSLVLYPPPPGSLPQEPPLYPSPQPAG